MLSHPVANIQLHPEYAAKSRLFFFLAALLLYIPFSWIKPTAAAQDWMDRSIAREFTLCENRGISKEWLETTWEACRKYKEFQRFQIIQSNVYGPSSRIKTLLEELVRKYPVQDVDFIYYYEDRLKKSFFKRKAHRQSAPIFVSAKSRGLQQAILFADWNYDIQDESDGWNFLIEKINEQQPKSNWSQKTEKLFWRGTPWDGAHFEDYYFENWTTIPRGRLVFDSQKYPELIDAAFSQYPAECARRDLNRCIAEMGKIQYVPWEKVLHYKYQMILDGVTCSFPATQWKLLSGCLSFKQDSENIQYYYDELIPWKHYIPVKRDLSDLKSKILWAIAHDTEAQEMAKNAREFALTHLMKKDILLYCYKVLSKYASLQRFQPSVVDL